MPKIILSYRRSDSDAVAGRLRDKLVSHYGDDSVFMDIDSIRSNWIFANTLRLRSWKTIF